MNKVRGEILREEAYTIIKKSIDAVIPDKAVRKELIKRHFHNPVFMIAIGKAAWDMANEAKKSLDGEFLGGIVVTKYHHSKGEIGGIEIIEAGHPTPDVNSVKAAEMILERANSLPKNTDILLLLSGGGSALAELPANGLDLNDIREVTERLLKSGASIQEMNAVRKRLSQLKGGRMAKAYEPRKIFAIILSDVIGNNPEMIASGITYPDQSEDEEIYEILHRYGIALKDKFLECFKEPAVKELNNVENIIIGSVDELCRIAAANAEKLGYRAYVLTTTLDCEAVAAGKWLASFGKKIQENSEGTKDFTRPCAIIAGGETIVKVTGNGLGGRNQEIALSGAIEIDGVDNVLLFSLGSDGTDGPTDAAGGIVDGNTVGILREKGFDAEAYLFRNQNVLISEVIQTRIKSKPLPQSRQIQRLCGSFGFGFCLGGNRAYSAKTREGFARAFPLLRNIPGIFFFKSGECVGLLFE
jgi:hydroxypyruvate reductase